jgi:nucleoside-diphosphate-sugar epimerase
MKDRILVTGANGFIGNRLVSFLSNKFIVKAVVRNFKSSVCIEKQYEIGSISRNTDWKACLGGVNTVIHLAGIAHNNSNDHDYINEVNVNGTINLAEQAASLGVKRFIFISSISVLGHKFTEPFHENSIISPQSYPAECKCKAESALLKISEESGLEVTIIRPALVYGADAPGNVGKLVKLIRKTPFLPFSLCRNKRSFISIDNLVDFISTCIVQPKAKNQIFCISDGNDVSIREFTDGIAKGLNKKVIQLPIPMSAFRLLGKVTRKSEPIEQLIGDLQVDSSKARGLLDWTPPVTMSETFSNLTNNK